MDGQSDILNLNDRAKRHLLGIGLEPEKPATSFDGNERRGDLLCDILRSPLPMESAERIASSPRVANPALAFRSVTGPPLRELLLDPKTEVSVLRRVKEYAKTMGQKATTEVEKDVYLAIYFAAIAAAWAYHGARITRHSDTEVGQFLVHYVSVKWVPSSLQQVFQKANQGRSEADQG